jgi:hypothetical protein
MRLVVPVTQLIRIVTQGDWLADQAGTNRILGTMQPIWKIPMKVSDLIAQLQGCRKNRSDVAV